MGLTLEFYVGDGKRIKKAIKRVVYEELDNPAVVQRRADFSLHIDPKDLNLLSRQFGLHTGSTALDLRPFLTPLVDKADRGLLSVDQTWVDYVASVDDGLINAIARGWYESLREEYPGEEIPDPSQDVIDAIRDLVNLCKEAKQKKAAVLHVWFL